MKSKAEFIEIHTLLKLLNPSIKSIFKLTDKVRPESRRGGRVDRCKGREGKSFALPLTSVGENY